jgi:precorrin-6B methylase 2
LRLFQRPGDPADHPSPLRIIGDIAAADKRYGLTDKDRWRQADKARGGIGKDAWQKGQTGALHCSGQKIGHLGKAQSHGRPGGMCGQPDRSRGPCKIGVKADQAVTGKIGRVGVRGMRRQIGGARVQRPSGGGDGAGDKIGVAGCPDANGKIRLSARKIGRLAAGDHLDRIIIPTGQRVGKNGRKTAGQGDAEGSFGIPGGSDKVVHRAPGSAGQRQKALSLAGQDGPRMGAQNKPQAQRLFQRADPAADGAVAGAHGTRSPGKAAAAGKRQERAQVVPVGRRSVGHGSSYMGGGGRDRPFSHRAARNSTVEKRPGRREAAQRISTGIIMADMNLKSNLSAIEQLRQFVGQASQTVVVLTALGLALRTRVRGDALEPEVAAAVAQVLAQSGLADAIAGAGQDELGPVLALIRAELMFGGHILGEGVGTRGWQDRDAGVMQVFGEVSLGFWRGLERLAAAVAPELLARLDAPGARFLDVGTGVGWLSIGMLQRWPALSAVGIEPLPGALALARRNLNEAGLAGRMELRQGFGESLEEVGAYDLIFVPSAFIPASALPAILQRARTALRPGGAVLLAVMEPPSAEAQASAGFRAAVWGGDVVGITGGKHLLRQAGFTRVDSTGQTGGMITFLLARDAPV